MGYRSNGMIYIPDKEYKRLPDDMKEELSDVWEKHETEKNVWTFEYWKWYNEFESVKFWNRLFNKQNTEIDLVVIGEDNAEVVSPNGNKFYSRLDIGFTK